MIYIALTSDNLTLTVTRNTIKIMNDGNHFQYHRHIDIIILLRVNFLYFDADRLYFHKR